MRSFHLSFLLLAPLLGSVLSAPHNQNNGQDHRCGPPVCPGSPQGPNQRRIRLNAQDEMVWFHKEAEAVDHCTAKGLNCYFGVGGGCQGWRLEDGTMCSCCDETQYITCKLCQP